MEKIKKILEEQLNDQLLQIVLSGKKRKEVTGNRKIRPILKKDQLFFQVSLQDGKKEFHENYEKGELIARICQWMTEDYNRCSWKAHGGAAARWSAKRGR